jgi:hypothetical protein
MHQYLKDAAVSSVSPISSSGTPGVVVFTATAADVKYIFTPARPVDVIRWGVIWTVAKDATQMILTLSKRPIAGLAAGKTVISTMTDSAARAAGSVTYVEPGTLTTAAATQSTGSDGSLVSVDPAGPFHVKMGEELSIELTDVADVSGQGYLFIEYQEYPFNTNDIGSGGIAVKLPSST